MKKISFIILSLCMTFTAFSKAIEPGTSQSKLLSPHAWYVLRQLNNGHLLLGLPQRLG
jgi:hypothetical protein